MNIKSENHSHSPSDRAHAEPSPLTGLRDMLADCFAAEINVAIPIVCEILSAQLALINSADTKTAMRESIIRLLIARAGIVSAVGKEVRNCFDQNLNPSLARYNKMPGFSLASLTLADNTRSAVDLALEKCASRLREQNGSELSALSRRLSAMLGKSHLSDSENPLLPAHFLQSLIVALRSANLNDTQLPICLKAFDPVLLSISTDLYVQANTMLAGHGHHAEITMAQENKAWPVSSIPSVRQTKYAAPNVADLLDRLLTGSGVLQAMRARQHDHGFASA